MAVILEGQFFMILSRAFESGVDCRALRTVSPCPALVLAASWFPVSISDFGCTWIAGTTSCQPTILSRTEASYEAC